MPDAHTEKAARGSGSFWEDEALENALDGHPLAKDHVYDLAIVGGGLAGISAALRASEIGLDTRLIEANAIGWGASGRNGGFCNLAPLKAFQGLLKPYGKAVHVGYAECSSHARLNN